jgi:hypothetical protein
MGRSSAEAKRMRAQRETEEGRAEHASSQLAAYHVCTQSEEHSEQERPLTSRESLSRRTQERQTERNTAARNIRHEDKESSDHERHQGRVARAAICQISGNRAQEQERARTKRRENEVRKLCQTARS